MFPIFHLFINSPDYYFTCWLLCISPLPVRVWCARCFTRRPTTVSYLLPVQLYHPVEPDVWWIWWCMIFSFFYLVFEHISSHTVNCTPPATWWTRCKRFCKLSHQMSAVEVFSRWHIDCKININSFVGRGPPYWSVSLYHPGAQMCSTISVCQNLSKAFFIGEYAFSHLHLNIAMNMSIRLHIKLLANDSLVS